MKQTAVALLTSSVLAQRFNLSPEEQGQDNCNVCIGFNKPYQYCPDGSCVSISDGVCTTSGSIATQKTGCKATTMCDVGTNGVLQLGQQDFLPSEQGGSEWTAFAYFNAPTGNPCTLMIYNPLNYAITFGVVGK